jgi:hypothetical protein
MPFEPQHFDVSVFDVFFGFGFLEGGVQAHSGSVARLKGKILLKIRVFELNLKFTPKICL